MILVYNSTGFVQQTIEEPVPVDYLYVLASHGLRTKIVPSDEMANVDLCGIWVDPTTDEVQTRPIIASMPSKLIIQADGIDTSTIDNLPDPVRVAVNDTLVELTGGMLVLKSRHKGTFDLVIDQWPYQRWTTRIEAKEV